VLTAWRRLSYRGVMLPELYSRGRGRCWALAQPFTRRLSLFQLVACF